MKKVSGYNIQDSQLHPRNAGTNEASTPYVSADSKGGLSELQKNMTDILQPWGFSNSNLKVSRQKIDNHNWQITVVNPKTRKTILEVTGHGDTVFAHEDNLARMAETLMAKGLTIRTHFDD